MNTNAAPPIKAGQEAVMQRWLMSAQKVRFKPSVMTSRSPKRTTRAVDIRSFGLLAMFWGLLQISLRWWQAFNRPRHHDIMEPVAEEFLPVKHGGSNHAKHTRTLRQAGPDPVAASDPDDGRHPGGEGKA